MKKWAAGFSYNVIDVEAKHHRAGRYVSGLFNMELTSNSDSGSHLFPQETWTPASASEHLSSFIHNRVQMRGPHSSSSVLVLAETKRGSLMLLDANVDKITAEMT